MAHPHNEHRQHRVEKSRVNHITKGYASGGAVHSDEKQDRKLIKKMMAEHEKHEVDGKHAKHRADRPKRKAGGHVKSSKAHHTEDKLKRAAFKERDAQAVQGEAKHERMNRPGRARGGKVKYRAEGGGLVGWTDSDLRAMKEDIAATRRSDNVDNVAPASAARASKYARGDRSPKSKTNVNVIVAPSGQHGMQAPSGVPAPAPAPAPMARPPMAMAPGAPPGLPAGGPPGMPPMGAPGMTPRQAGGRAYAKGGGVKSGPAWEEGVRNGTQPQNNPSGKNDQRDINRPRPITYKTGGRIYSPEKGGMGPKFDGGAGGGTARLEKEKRAERKYARA